MKRICRCEMGLLESWSRFCFGIIIYRRSFCVALYTLDSLGGVVFRLLLRNAGTATLEVMRTVSLLHLFALPVYGRSSFCEEGLNDLRATAWDMYSLKVRVIRYDNPLPPLTPARFAVRVAAGGVCLVLLSVSSSVGSPVSQSCCLQRLYVERATHPCCCSLLFVSSHTDAKWVGRKRWHE